VIKSKKESSLVSKDGGFEKIRIVKSLRKSDGAGKSKPYPILEEDSYIPPDDDSAEVKYTTKK